MIHNSLRTYLKNIFVFIFLFSFYNFYSQVSSSNTYQDIDLDPIRVALFEKYPEFKYNLIPGGWQNIKTNNQELYKKELWYYTESFYIKKDHFSSGISLPESAIDISRFEQKRNNQTEVMVTLDGFKDVIILKPGKDLIYKPN